MKRKLTNSKRWLALRECPRSFGQTSSLRAYEAHLGRFARSRSERCAANSICDTNEGIFAVKTFWRPTRPFHHDRRARVIRLRAGSTGNRNSYSVHQFPCGHFHAIPPRTKPGSQYADLSSLTMHVVHWELRRAPKSVLYPIARTRVSD